MRRTTGTLLATALVAALSTLVGGPASADAPVVVDDEITLWPGQRTDINVLENDTDPDGDFLVICRLPAGSSAAWAPIFVEDTSLSGYGPAGELKVVPQVWARGTYTIEYDVCDETHLSPATLTVHVRPVSPVVVTKMSGQPGRLRVKNTNDRRIHFMATSRSGCTFDGEGQWVGPHRTRTVRVHLRAVHWRAAIGGQLGFSSGIADQGIVRDIPQDDPPPAGATSVHC